MNMGYTAAGWTYLADEHHIYGSSRVGVHNTHFVLAKRFSTAEMEYTQKSGNQVHFIRGKRNYELSNHLGNVQVVISDKRISVCDNELQTERFEADILMATDYYPFGMAIPELQWYTGSDSSNYRYGFNGQEKDNEVAGVGNSMTAEFWQYDSRLGRRFNRDPKPNALTSEYACFANNPIWYSDPLGDTLKISYYSGFLGLGKMKTVIYKEGSLFNEDGSAFQGKTKGFLKQSLDALNDIRNTKEGGSMLEELEGSTKVFTIAKRLSYTTNDKNGQVKYHSGNQFVSSDIYKAYGNQFQTDPELSQAYNSKKAQGIDFNGGSGGTIYWNPYGGVSLKESGSSPTNRPTIFLSHELFHGRDANRGLLDSRKYFGLPKSEWQATYSENIMRMQMGIPLRSHYGSIKVLNNLNSPYLPPKF